MPPASTLRSLFTSCIFATLVFSTVESLKCTQCSPGQCDDSSNRTPCETSQNCFSSKQQLDYSGDGKGVLEEKGCSKSACTSLTFSGTLGDNQAIGYNYQCCDSDLCNEGDIQLPQQSTDPNGVECPACYKNDGSKFCIPSILHCKGTERKCVEVTLIDKTVPSSPLLYGMGCATESACNVNTDVMSNQRIEIRCVDPTSGSPPLAPIISSTLTGLLLLKLLL